MKRYLRYFGLFAFIFIVHLSTVNDKVAKVITCPAPPGLQTSPDIKVAVNNVPVWVERAGSSTALPLLPCRLFSQDGSEIRRMLQMWPALNHV